MIFFLHFVSSNELRIRSKRSSQGQEAKELLLQIYAKAFGIDFVTIEDIRDVSCFLSDKGRKHKICCSCSSTCMLKKECCLDIAFKSALKANIKPMAYLDKFLQKANEVKKVCTPVLPMKTDSHRHKVQGVMMIADCPYKFITTKIMQRKCTGSQQGVKNLHDILPVIGVDNEIYKNRFCAICNGIQSYQWLQTQFSSCKSFDVETRPMELNTTQIKNFNIRKIKDVTDRNTSCIVIGLFKEASPETCRFKRDSTSYEKLNRRCSEAEFHFCQSYIAVTRASGEIFYNPTCAKCHFGYVATTFDQCHGDMPEKMDRGSLISPYSLLFSFTEVATVQMIKRRGKSALVDEIKCNIDHFNINSWKCDEDVSQRSDNNDSICNIDKKLRNNSNFSKHFKCKGTEVFKSSKELYNWEVNIAIVEDVSSITLLVFSVTALLATTVVYGILGELRTVCGRFLIMFFLAVLLSDVTVLVGATGKICEICCKIVAVCLHYFSLASQLWTLVIVFDLMLMVRYMSHQRRSNGSFCLCNLAVWGSTTVIVGICVYLDQSSEGLVKYGFNKICWIGSIKASIFSYLVPTFLALFFHLILLLIIYMESKKITSVMSRSMAYRQQGVSFASLMLKIAFLFGLSEMLGLIQLRESSEVNKLVSAVFRLLYTAIRSSRGIFVFAVLIVNNKEAKRLLKQKFYANAN